jgi:hypothetical protein
MTDSHDPLDRRLDACAVNSLIETPGCDPVAGRVVWDPLHSLWNGSMLAATLIAGPLTVSPAAIAVFVLTTGATLLLGHSIGFHRRMIHGSFQCPLWLEHVLVWIGTAVGMSGPFWMIRAHDLRDWAQRQPDCHDYLSNRRPMLVDAVWQMHGRLMLERPPAFESAIRPTGVAPRPGFSLSLFSWPTTIMQARARMSRPRGVRIGEDGSRLAGLVEDRGLQRRPRSSKPALLSRRARLPVRALVGAGPGIERDQVDLGRDALDQLDQGAASSGLSLTPFSMTYSNVTRRALLRGPDRRGCRPSAVRGRVFLVQRHQHVAQGVVGGVQADRQHGLGPGAQRLQHAARRPRSRL